MTTFKEAVSTIKQGEKLIEDMARDHRKGNLTDEQYRILMGMMEKGILSMKKKLEEARKFKVRKLK